MSSLYRRDCGSRGGTAGAKVAIICQRRVDVLLMPPLEHDELPQPQRVVALAGQVLVDELADEGRLEVAALEAGGRQQRVGEQFAQVAAEPGAERHAEPLLAADRADRAGQQRGRDFFQDVLAPAVLDLHRRRQRRRQTRRPRCRAAARATRSSAPCSCGRPWSARLPADRSRRRTASSGDGHGRPREALEVARELLLGVRLRRIRRRASSVSSAGFSSAPKNRIASR